MNCTQNFLVYRTNSLRSQQKYAKKSFQSDNLTWLLGNVALFCGGADRGYKSSAMQDLLCCNQFQLQQPPPVPDWMTPVPQGWWPSAERNTAGWVAISANSPSCTPPSVWQYSTDVFLFSSRNENLASSKKVSSLFSYNKFLIRSKKFFLEIVSIWNWSQSQLISHAKDSAQVFLFCFVSI